MKHLKNNYFKLLKKHYNKENVHSAYNKTKTAPITRNTQKVRSKVAVRSRVC